MIKVDSISKSYGRTAALKDISFSVEEGEVLGFLGPNGAGKTTTMRILTCFLPPGSGTAKIRGCDILNDSMGVRRMIGYLPENVPLYGDMTVRSYLDFVAKLKEVPGKDRKIHIGQVMDECGVTTVERKLIKTLSKGFKQRIGIAQALIGNPPILILDEPTVGLDPKQIIEIRELIRRFAGHKTVILSTHILPEVSQVCTRVLIINEGRIIAQDSPQHLASGLGETVTVAVEFTGLGGTWEQALRSIKGVRSVSVEEQPEGAETIHAVVEADKKIDVRPQLASAIVKKGGSLLEMRLKTMSLEDVFIQLVTEEQKETTEDDGGSDE